MCYWPLPELQRPLRFFKFDPIASVGDMHRLQRGRPLQAGSVARGVTALAAAEVGAASAHKRSSRGESAATGADLARGGRTAVLPPKVAAWRAAEAAAARGAEYCNDEPARQGIDNDRQRSASSRRNVSLSGRCVGRA